jgi:hypothetical protein
VGLLGLRNAGRGLARCCVSDMRRVVACGGWCGVVDCSRKGLWLCAARRGARVAMAVEGLVPICGVGHVSKACCSSL